MTEKLKLLFFFVGAVLMGCGSGPKRQSPGAQEDSKNWKGYQVFVMLSPKSGQVGKRYKGQIGYRPTRHRPQYIKEPMFLVKNLPAGLGFDSRTGVISGIPGEAGEFNILVKVRDKSRGTHSGRDWYLESFYLKIKKFNDLR